MPVRGVTLDSAAVLPGDLFAALPGARTHGARYAAAAAAAGATAVVTDHVGVPDADAAGLPALVVDNPRAVLGSMAARIYGDPSAHLDVIGVTGTNGKTTVAHLVEAGMRQAGVSTGLLGTVEARLGDERLPAVRTTPEAPDLQALLAVARERGVRTLVMEVSSHALALGRVGGVRFAAAGFTNLGSDHLDFHGDLEDYFAAKARLFDGRAGVEVVNVDDPAGRRLVGPATVTVSGAGAPTASWRVTAREPGRFGQAFALEGPRGVALRAEVGMPGPYNVDNALLAVALLDAVGVDPPDAVAGIAGAGVPGRMERVDAAEPVLAVVDYAHDPHSVAAALAALRPVTPGRLLCVLGCGGDRDTAKRAAMGEAAARGADVFVATDDNPRSEDPAAIRAAMLAGVLAVPPGERGEVVEIAGRGEAVAEAVRRSRPGDTVAVLGKGHEQGQQIAGVVHPFDDRTTLSAALLAEYDPDLGRRRGRARR